MARILSLEDCQKIAEAGPSQTKDDCYNALDVTGTREIADVLLPRLTDLTRPTYNFERALQNPAFAMMARGVRVDTVLRDKMVKALEKELKIAEAGIAKMPEVLSVWDGTELETGVCVTRPFTPSGNPAHHKWPKGVPDAERKCEVCEAPRVKPKPFNAGSPDQNQHLFYELHGITPLRNKKGEVGVDEDILDRIGHKNPKLKGLTDAILHIRDLDKQLGTLRARLTGDNRYPSSFNVGAAWTGRFSSSQNPYRQGGNLQNVSERHRSIFIADPGYQIGYADLKTAESLVVAHRAGDEQYILAHKGDVHTFVARETWPSLPWTGDIKQDKKIAQSLFPEWDNIPGHDYRFQSKSIQHGSNLGLTARGIALQKRIPMSQAETAQASYFRAFPFIRGWQEWIAKQVRDHVWLVNPLGRTIQLFGRPWDKHTINQGLAFEPQSTVADILDLAMWRVWWAMDPHEVQILAQVHDAILFQFPKGRLDLVKKLVGLMRVPVDVPDYRGNVRRMVISVEVAVGDNWGHKSPSNPYGIEEVHL